MARFLEPFFLFLKFTCFVIISRSSVKGFRTKVKISTQNHQRAHKLKYGTSTSHESKASQLAQNDPPLFPLHKKIRHYSHFTKRFAVIAQGCRVEATSMLCTAGVNLSLGHLDFKKGILVLLVSLQCYFYNKTGFARLGRIF